MEITGSEDFYSLMAPYYAEYCQSRSDYLASVDQVISANMPAGADSLLDVGAGDGLRGMRLALNREISFLVLVEPNESMAIKCEQRKAAEVWRVKAEELAASDYRFDVMICLWNVLGHIPDNASRLAALRRMRSFLPATGRLFLDVNNRYNGRAYGWLKTLARFFYDLLMPSEANGDVNFEWRIHGVSIQARGHVFTPGEIARLIDDSGLKVVRRHVVDYQTGKLRRLAVGGQLLFELRSGE